MSKSWNISRRSVLRGLGTMVALPWLEALQPAAWGAPAGAGSAGPAPAGPRRLAVLYVPNGVSMDDWTPKNEGSNYDLSWTLEPLAAHKADFCVLSGLAQQKANANGDGGGDHARALATFLTGTQARKTSGADIRAGQSIDQAIATRIGNKTRFPSLELGCEAGQQAGNCDSGYSCAYSSNISWRTENQPVPKEVNPRLVFERLFSGGPQEETQEARARRQRYNKSVLDFVMEDAKRLQVRLASTDRRKLDEYLSSVRELEVRLARNDQGEFNAGNSKIARPTGVPSDYEQHVRLMADLLVLSFQADVTRVATFVFSNEGSNRSYSAVGVPDAHHELSHHGRDQKKLEKIRTIDRFLVSQYAYLVDRLKGIKEGNGTLLDNCLVVYGSGIGDGDRHSHGDLPILLAGRGGGRVKPGRHIQFEKKTPLMNLFLTLAAQMDVELPALGDSTGRVSGLEG